MARRLFVIPTILTIALIGAVVFARRVPQQTNTAPTFIENSDTALRRTMTTLSLEQKIGQLIIAGVRGYTFDAATKELIDTYHIGAFNLFGRNIKTANQTSALTQEIQEHVYRDQGFSALIGVDQEGGAVIRAPFLKERTGQPGIRTDAEARAIAMRRGKELRTLGFTMIFSPVLDYATDPRAAITPRTFRGSPRTIARLGAAMIEGYRASGIIPVAKHFPGYGNSRSHLDFTPRLVEENQTLVRDALTVFKKILTATSTPALMTAHITIPFIDSRPATLSRQFVTEMLRNQWTYDGVVMTDDLEMAAARGMPIGVVAVEALRAGHDMVMLSPSPEHVPRVIKAIKDAVRNGSLTETELDEKVFRILRLKQSITEHNSSS